MTFGQAVLLMGRTARTKMPGDCLSTFLEPLPRAVLVLCRWRPRLQLVDQISFPLILQLMPRSLFTLASSMYCYSPLSMRAPPQSLSVELS